MKVQVNDQDIFEVTAIQKKVFAHEHCSETVDDILREKLKWILMEKHRACMERMRKHWEPILGKTLTSLPTDDDAFANLVFAHPDYRSRSQLDAEMAAKEAAKLQGAAV